MKHTKDSKEEHSQEKKNKSPQSRILITLIMVVLLFGGAVGGLLYYQYSQTRIYIEKSEINAPLITLSPSSQGILEKVFVREGDKIRENMIVAKVSGKYITAKEDGIVVSVQNTPGQIVTLQSPVVQMINPSEFRLIGHIQEDKGLNEIHLGQSVLFTVDAFDGKNYFGTVESISPASRESDIVFSISDKREEKQFDIKVKYDISKYPELKNGMSARMWIYK